MSEVILGAVLIGEIGIWKHYSGETHFEVLEHNVSWGKTLVRADNGLSYEWPNDLKVFVE